MAAAIETKHLTKVYGSARGITDVDLVVPAGVVFGFLGPNGAGKSTTIRVLMDFLRPSNGRALVLARAGRQVTIRFDEPVDPSPFRALRGVSAVTAHDRSLSMRVRGELDTLVKLAAEHHVVDLLSAPPELEDIFLAYYRQDDADGRNPS